MSPYFYRYMEIDAINYVCKLFVACVTYVANGLVIIMNIRITTTECAQDHPHRVVFIIAFINNLFLNENLSASYTLCHCDSLYIIISVVQLS